MRLSIVGSQITRHGLWEKMRTGTAAFFAFKQLKRGNSHSPNDEVVLVLLDQSTFGAAVRPSKSLGRIAQKPRKNDQDLVQGGHMQCIHSMPSAWSLPAPKSRVCSILDHQHVQNMESSSRATQSGNTLPPVVLKLDSLASFVQHSISFNISTMAAPFPYTHYVCPCSSNTPETKASDAVESAPFNPHSRSAQYSLFPLDHLLYCDECETPRCPRCVTEDVLSWYCPNCLFEVPSSSVRGEGNRCSRNCFECPVCEAPVNITAVPAIHPGRTVSSDHLKPSDAPRHQERDRDDENAAQEYILQCGYCNWSTLDVDARLPKSVKIGDQLSKIRKTRLQHGNLPRSPERTVTDSEHEETSRMSHDTAYNNLASFYKTQMSEALGESGDLYGSTNSPYSSPANLARIMSLYSTSASFQAMKKIREKPQPFAEARSHEEGMSAYYPSATGTREEPLSPASDDQEIIETLSSLGFDHTTSSHQRLSAPGTNFAARFISDLWPTATKLRTKRGKRCRTCRQYLSRPDPKLNNLRYKIRLLASNHLPLLTTKPLNPVSPVAQGSAAFQLREEDVALSGQPTLVSGRALQYVLTLRNPIFEPIKITLATPQITPGRASSRVTVLCPSFTVGPAGDVWEEALGSSTTIVPPTGTDGGRRAALASLSADEKVPEAGKIWDKTRNTTSVVMEIVPGELSPSSSSRPKDSLEDEDDDAVDEDVLELPIFVHMEWTAHHHNDPHASGEKRNERERRVVDSADAAATATMESEKKELGFWCVLGLGRIATR
nr:isoform 3 of dynactin subunit 4 [Quercus suber]